MSTPKVHRLKTEHRFWLAVFRGHKTFEVRRNDRDFKRGDVLVLLDLNAGEASGREIVARVTYMLEGGQFGLEAGHVVMAIEVMEAPDGDELARARAEILAHAEEDSRQPCDCIDCDGSYCVSCLEHHKGEPCPFVEGIREELGEVTS